jgi:hypothetical protein
MMALELLDTKGQGGNSARPGAAQADVSAPRMALDRSGVVQRGDDVGCPVMHRLGKDAEVAARPSAEASIRGPGTKKCLTTSDYPYGGDDVVRSGSLSV